MFQNYDWHDFYCDAAEAISSDVSIPGVDPMMTHCFVDGSHGGDCATSRLQTGILIFCNKAPVKWYGKWQNTMEASTFGIQAMKNAIKLTTEVLASTRP